MSRSGGGFCPSFDPGQSSPVGREVRVSAGGRRPAQKDAPHATHSPHYNSRSCFRSHPDRINVARLGGALLPARGRLGLSRQLPVQNLCPMQGYSIRHKRRLRDQSAICIRTPRADTAAARYEQRLEQQRLEQPGLEQRQPEQPWWSGWRLGPRYVQALSVGAAVGVGGWLIPATAGSR
jgi:hypothetical protein